MQAARHTSATWELLLAAATATCLAHHYLHLSWQRLAPDILQHNLCFPLYAIAAAQALPLQSNGFQPGAGLACPDGGLCTYDRTCSCSAVQLAVLVSQIRQ